MNRFWQWVSRMSVRYSILRSFPSWAIDGLSRAIDPWTGRLKTEGLPRIPESDITYGEDRHVSFSDLNGFRVNGVFYTLGGDYGITTNGLSAFHVTAFPDGDHSRPAEFCFIKDASGLYLVDSQIV